MVLDFLEGSQEKYDNIEAKQSGTFYLTEKNLYLGDIKLNNQDIVGDLRDLTTTDKENLVNVINEVIGIIETKADINSPNLTGTPTAPTASEETNDSQIANTRFVKTAIANLINGAPTTLDTIKKLADAIQENKTIIEALDAAIGNKVDKVDGKGLSTNDYTDTEKAKLNGIAAGAEVNVQPDWNETVTTNDAYIKNKPNFIVSGTQTLTSNDNGGINTYTFTSSNGSTSAFNVKNGSKGDTGQRGSNIIYGTELDQPYSSSTYQLPKPNSGTYCVNDIYINTSKWYAFRCESVDTSGISKWRYIGCLKGGSGIRGSQIYQGRNITGTSTSDTVFSGSGVENALVNDVYINTSTCNIYQCTIGGNASTAKWIYKSNISGKRSCSIFITSGLLDYAGETSSFQLLETELPETINNIFPVLYDLCISTTTFNMVRCVSAYNDPGSSYNSFKLSEWEYVGCIRDNNPGTSELIGETIENKTLFGTNAIGGSNSVSIGSYSNASGPSSISIGENSVSSEARAIAIGSKNAVSTGLNSIAIGSNAKATSDNSISIGAYTNTSWPNAISIGVNSYTSGSNSIVIGDNAHASGSGIAIGLKTNSGTSSIAIGSFTNSHNNSIIIGSGSTKGQNQYCIGYMQGTSSSASYSNSIAIGKNVCNSANDSICIGFNSGTGSSSISIGKNIKISSMGSVAIGHNAMCGVEGGGISGSLSYDSIAIGYNSNTGGNGTIAIGYGSTTFAYRGIAIGASTNAAANYSVALGSGAVTTNANSIQLGDAVNLSSITSKVELTVTSDERDKINIEPIDYGAIDFINQIEPITYLSNQRILYIDNDENLSEKDKENKYKYGLCNYNKKEHQSGTRKGSRKRVGVSAQQVQKALQNVYGSSSYANLVNDNLFDYDQSEIPEGVESQLAVNYPGFVPFLIKAIQELSQRLEKLEEKA